MFAGAYDQAPARLRPVYGALNYRRKVWCRAAVRVRVSAAARRHARPRHVLLPRQPSRTHRVRRRQPHVADRARPRGPSRRARRLHRSQVSAADRQAASVSPVTMPVPSNMTARSRVRADASSTRARRTRSSLVKVASFITGPDPARSYVAAHQAARASIRLSFAVGRVTEEPDADDGEARSAPAGRGDRATGIRRTWQTPTDSSAGRSGCPRRGPPSCSRRSPSPSPLCWLRRGSARRPRRRLASGSCAGNPGTSHHSGEVSASTVDRCPCATGCSTPIPLCAGRCCGT
jgi:hypothetical protein